MTTNHTKFAILGVLTTGCRSGYSIKQMIDTSLNHFWKISYGQIYPTLKKLVDEGLASVQEHAQEDKPDKKEYHLTDKGKEALHAWLAEPLESIPKEKNEWLLKLFFSRHQDRSNTLELLKNYHQNLQSVYTNYQAIEEMIRSNHQDDEDAMYWLFTLDYGKRTTYAAIEWSEDTIRAFKEEKR
ncbi:PadR family transcriptional regulator [Halobacillus litoralis]|uniref:PadR family transcriptional regulator n=1 Tax=Halobacillus litoralis TaxID=45668 RepID=UPI001CD21AD7|nr:PadR family transcriptional regulator [Halobacillus litoralis]MCA0971695.1 PadR family transcriptional regulator [Halobacillus litoralis]